MSWYSVYELAKALSIALLLLGLLVWAVGSAQGRKW